MSTSHYSECSVISVAQLHTMLGLLARAGLALKPLLCFSVEREGRKRLSRHGSVEIFDGSYNLTVPHRLFRHTSTSSRILEWYYAFFNDGVHKPNRIIRKSIIMLWCILKQPYR